MWVISLVSVPKNEKEKETKFVKYKPKEYNHSSKIILEPNSEKQIGMFKLTYIKN